MSENKIPYKIYLSEDEMPKVRNLGRQYIEEVVKKLEELGLSPKAQED